MRSPRSAPSTSADTNLSTLKLKIDPGPFQYLPSNVEAEIKSSTAFGAKYVDLVVPGRRARVGAWPPVPCCARATSPSRSTPSSRTCSRWCSAIDPAKLNSVFIRGRRSRPRQGRADRTGDHRRQQDPAGGQPAHAHRAAGLAVVRPDRAGVFRCRTGHPVHPGLVHHHQHDDHLERRRAGQPAAVRRRASPSPASTPSAATSPTWCGR